MNKLVKKFVSLVLAVESFSVLGAQGRVIANGDLKTWAEYNTKFGTPCFFRNEYDEVVDSFGTIVRKKKGPVVKVPESFFDKFPLWDKSKSPLKNYRSDEEILESLSKKAGHGLGRNDKNELISIRYGEKILNSGRPVMVPDRYYKDFPLVDVEMSEKLYRHLIDEIKSHQVYRNKNYRLVDEFGNGLKYGGKFIRVPTRYCSEIHEHPWEEGVRKGEVFLDSWDDFGTKVFKVVNKNNDLINSDLSISCKYNDQKKNEDWGCGTGFWYNTRPNCIDIPLLDRSDKNLIKYNESLKYEKYVPSSISYDIKCFERKCKSCNTPDNQENTQLYVEPHDEQYDKEPTIVKEKDNHFSWTAVFLLSIPVSALFLLNGSGD